jgi:hypothetical protein
MLEACITAGAFEGQSGRPVMGIDGVGHEANEAVVTMLNAIVQMALSNYIPDYLNPKA